MRVVKVRPNSKETEGLVNFDKALQEFSDMEGISVHNRQASNRMACSSLRPVGSSVQNQLDLMPDIGKEATVKIEPHEAFSRVRCDAENNITAEKEQPDLAQNEIVRPNSKETEGLVNFDKALQEFSDMEGISVHNRQASNRMACSSLRPVGSSVQNQLDLESKSKAEDAAANEDVRVEHSRSKPDKKRLKQMMGPAPQTTQC
ncbi:hypothetical protein OPV22_034562 [Ensete ventricosum]|uniref:Uncharacterized protein n=1 Tax=Ensete ventricosum TaxID=4639 RepID=A0AAV8P201_ENSVE|nr:hypothetical protein OPV22_034562 [Ensete ventricosum]